MPRPSGLMRKEDERPGGGRSRRRRTCLLRETAEATVPLLGRRTERTDEWPAGKTDDGRERRTDGCDARNCRRNLTRRKKGEGETETERDGRTLRNGRIYPIEFCGLALAAIWRRPCRRISPSSSLPSSLIIMSHPQTSNLMGGNCGLRSSHRPLETSHGEIGEHASVMLGSSNKATWRRRRVTFQLAG